MSYEPSLIISYKDLHNNEFDVEEKYYLEKFKNTSEMALYEELYRAMKLPPLKLKNIQFVIIKPELTSHNALVRKWLHNNDVHFTVDN